MRRYYAMPVMAKAFGRPYSSKTGDGIAFFGKVITAIRKGVLVTRNFGGPRTAARYGASVESIGRWAGVCRDDQWLLQRALELAAEVMEVTEPGRFKRSQGKIDKETLNGDV